MLAFSLLLFQLAFYVLNLVTETRLKIPENSDGHISHQFLFNAHARRDAIPNFR